MHLCEPADGKTRTLTRGRWNDAREYLLRAEERDYPSAIFTRLLLYLHPDLEISPQDLTRVLDGLDRLGAESIKRFYGKGLLLARLEEFSEAREQEKRLEAIRIDLEEQGDGASIFALYTRDLAHGIRTEIALVQGNPAEALTEIEKTRPEDFSITDQHIDLFLGHAHLRYLRAALLEETGQYEEALGWYESLGQIAYGETIYLAPKHLRMAQILERLGKTDEAIEHYTRFVELWKDCDPELRHLVEDAKLRLQGLMGESG